MDDKKIQGNLPRQHMGYDSVHDTEEMVECSPGSLWLRSNRGSKSVVEGGRKSVCFIVN